MKIKLGLCAGLLTCSLAAAQATRPARPAVDYSKWASVVTQVTGSELTAGTLEKTVAAEGAIALPTEARERGFPLVGLWTGCETPSAIPFVDLLATFNVSTPGKTGAILEARVKTGATGGWSPWVYVQSWGKTTTSTSRVDKFDGGRLDVDTLKLTQPATAYQLRVRLESFDYDSKVVPSVRRVSTCASGPVEDDAERQTLRAVTIQGEWAKDLGVPFRAQGALDLPRPIWGEICSPTSTTMVLAYYGTDLKTLDNAEAIYDPTFDLFGNWGRAVSRAGELGYDAWLERFYTHDQVKAKIAAGIPVIASIRFKKGEVTGFLLEATAGHLIVIRGMTPEGDYIVNDPARRETGNHQIYKAAEMAKAWFDKGGVGYVITKPAISH